MSDNKIYDKIPSMELAELYQLYVSIMYDFIYGNIDDEDVTNEYNTIRDGENSQFEARVEIHDIIDEEESVVNPNKPNPNKAIIINPRKQEVIIYGKSYPLFNYRSEKERRKALLQRRLLDEFSDDNLPHKSDLEY